MAEFLWISVENLLRSNPCQVSKISEILYPAGLLQRRVQSYSYVPIQAHRKLGIQ